MSEPWQAAGVGPVSLTLEYPDLTIRRGERMSEPWQAAGVGPRRK